MPIPHLDARYQHLPRVTRSILRWYRSGVRASKARLEAPEAGTMTLNELVTAIVSRGYRMFGDKSLCTMDGPVANAPMVLIPAFPIVKDDCKFITDVLPDVTQITGGMAKVEGAATVLDPADNRITVVRLQFLPVGGER